jgi:hypothetical protein
MFKFRSKIATVAIIMALALSAHSEQKDISGKTSYAPAAAVPNSAAIAAAATSGVAQPTPQPGISPSGQKPSRWFIQIQRYNVKNNGQKSNPISNVRITVTFPNKTKLTLPESGQYWPIGNGQVQEINRTYELPAQLVVNDGFKFTIQMENKGDAILPCEFDVVQISQFNRAYVCSTDVGWQKVHNVPEDQLDEQAVQVRVFTDINSEKKEIPPDAIALK